MLTLRRFTAAVVVRASVTSWLQRFLVADGGAGGEWSASCWHGGDGFEFCRLAECALVRGGKPTSSYGNGASMR